MIILGLVPQIASISGFRLAMGSDYEEGYAKGFADGYERALRNTPTFPMVSTSPAHIVPDQLQGWRLEE